MEQKIFASACQSDRLVQISSEVREVLKALEKISYKLRETPPKRVISLKPAYSYGSVPPRTSSAYSYGSVPSRTLSHMSSYSDHGYSAHRSSNQRSSSYANDVVTTEISVLESAVGGLIGKRNSNNSKTRQEK
ncbi:hypothetical protein AMTR_s00176p00040580 [Amborella trichopoda]|uniref:Uncharacterized protein n=1 Tax=Amborella trichopoda TaxID=13333 RepID=W1PUJ3_AMBTC|nr:hypothetical protein AMTR_s00176p00040580 [Amborella trichopoda]